MRFLRVDSTHGVLEAGRDVVVADLDKFGLLHYWAIQVKDGDLRSSSETNELRSIIGQVQTAYETSYRDVATGAEHKIRGVYLIVNGSITEAAKNILYSRTGSWLHILDRSHLELAARIRLHVDEEQRLSRALRLEVHLELLAPRLEGLLSQLTNIENRTQGGLTISWIPLHTNAVDDFLEFAVLELNTNDSALLLALAEEMLALQYFLGKIPIGAVNMASIRESLVAMRSTVEQCLTLCRDVQRLLSWYQEQDSPLPGTLLPPWPDPPLA